MPIFEYRGFNVKGKAVKGTVESGTLEEAREKLRASGIYPEKIVEVKKRFVNRSLFGTFRRQKLVYLFAKQLSFLLEASLPIVDAIDSIISQVENIQEKQLLTEIRERLREGEPLSKALSYYPEYFSPLFRNTVLAGEISGDLGRVFRHLAIHYERNQRLIGTLKSSLTYPLFMLFFAISVVVFLVTFIVPSFRNLFDQFGKSLPLPTKLLLKFSDFLSGFWWLILLILILMVYLFREMYKKRSRFKDRIDRFILKLPVAGELILNSFRIRFSYTMSLMISNGVGIIDALNTVKDMFKNSLFRKLIVDSVEKIKKGDRFSSSIADGYIIPPSISGMINAGESSDRLAEILNSISVNLESQLERKVKSLTSLIEPVIIIVIGGFVGFVVLSIMLPIFQINQMF